MHFLGYRLPDILEMSNDQLEFAMIGLNSLLEAKYGKSDKSSNSSNNRQNQEEDRIITTHKPIDDNANRILDRLREIKEKTGKVDFDLLNLYIKSGYAGPTKTQ